MTDQEKDKKIGTLKKYLDAAKKRVKKLQQERASADTTIYKLALKPEEVFTERLKRQHVVLLQLAAFAEGIMLAELVDNPSENLGYAMGCDRVKSFIMASEAIALEK